MPWVLFLTVRLLGIDSTAVLVAAIGLTPYVAATSLLPILLAASLRVWPAAIAGIAIAAIFAVLVLPRAFGAPTELLPDGGARGSGLYSRYRLVDPHNAEVLRAFPFLTGTVVAPGAQPIDVSSVHTVPPTEGGWRRDLDAIPAAPESGRAILLGDFNATLDHAPFRGVLDHAWDDAAATVGSGLVPTWPADRKLVPPLYAIDHVLVGESIGVREFSVHDIDGTDHRAIFAELQLPGT